MKEIIEKKRIFFDKEKEKRFQNLVRDGRIKDASEILQLYSELAIQSLPILIWSVNKKCSARVEIDFIMQDAEEVVSESISAGLNFLKIQLSSNYEGTKRSFEYQPDIPLICWLKIIIYNRKFGILKKYIDKKIKQKRWISLDEEKTDITDESQQDVEKVMAVSEGIKALKDKSQWFILQCRFYGFATVDEVIHAAMISGYCKDQSVLIGTRSANMLKKHNGGILTQREIAEILGVTDRTIRNKMKKSYDELRKYVIQKGL